MLRLAALGLGLIQMRLSGQPKPGPLSGCPAFHRDHAVIDVEPEVLDEPVAHLAQGEAVAHWHRPGADEAFLPRQEQRAFNRPSGRIGPI
jgi:hypothetical protein